MKKASKEHLTKVRREAAVKRWGEGERPEEYKRIRCDKRAADKLAKYCKAHGVAQVTIVKQIIENYLHDSSKK